MEGEHEQHREIYNSQGPDTSFSLDSFQYDDKAFPIGRILGDVSEMVENEKTILGTIQDLRAHVQAAVETPS